MRIRKLACLVAGIVVVCSAFALAACDEKPEPKPAGITHDRVTLQVTGKDTYEPHNYVDGKCTMCEETTSFTQVPLMNQKEILQYKPAKSGKVEKIEYDTRAYFAETQTEGEDEIHVKKTAYVYLPSNYDGTKKFNVLYMMHGNKLNEGYWFAQGSYDLETGDATAFTGGYGTENVIEYLIANNKMEDTIFVTPTFYTRPDLNGDGVPDTDFDDNMGADSYFRFELFNDLMPYIAENYSTYAVSGSAEDLKAARNHQGFNGLSRGSALVSSVIWQYGVEYFSYIANFSGGAGSQGIVDNYKEKFSSLPLKYWYVGYGSTEDYAGVMKNYVAMRDGLGLQQGKTCDFVLSNKTGHNYATWITCLYNSLQVFFKG